MENKNVKKYSTQVMQENYLIKKDLGRAWGH